MPKNFGDDTMNDDTPPPGWHICDCSEDCGAWEPDEEADDE